MNALSDIKARLAIRRANPQGIGWKQREQIMLDEDLPQLVAEVETLRDRVRVLEEAVNAAQLALDRLAETPGWRSWLRETYTVLRDAQRSK
jgi:hypothetical protein